MSFTRVLFSLAIAFLLVIPFTPSQKPAMEMIPVALPTTCICFEYFYNDLPEADRIIYQSCDLQLLDQLADPSLEVYTFSLPCEEVFVGTRQVDAMSIEPVFVQVDGPR